jgi:hypothetical protein
VLYNRRFVVPFPAGPEIHLRFCSLSSLLYDICRGVIPSGWSGRDSLTCSLVPRLRMKAASICLSTYAFHVLRHITFHILVAKLVQLSKVKHTPRSVHLCKDVYLSVLVIRIQQHGGGFNMKRFIFETFCHLFKAFTALYIVLHRFGAYRITVFPSKGTCLM